MVQRNRQQTCTENDVMITTNIGILPLEIEEGRPI